MRARRPRRTQKGARHTHRRLPPLLHRFFGEIDAVTDTLPPLFVQLRILDNSNVQVSPLSE